MRPEKKKSFLRPRCEIAVKKFGKKIKTVLISKNIFLIFSGQDAVQGALDYMSFSTALYGESDL